MLQFAQVRFVIARGICFAVLFLRLIKWRQQGVLSIGVEHSWASRRGIIESWNIKMQWRGCVQCYPLVDTQKVEKERRRWRKYSRYWKCPSHRLRNSRYLFSASEDRGLGIPDAESGKKKGREKSYSTVQWRWISLCNGRENRLVCLAQLHARMCVSSAIVARMGNN